MAVRLSYLVHSSRGRTRVRLPWLRREPELAAAIAEALEKLSGMERVEVKPYTGSVLCTYDPEELQEEALLGELCRITGVVRVVRPGETAPEEEEELLRIIQDGNNLAVEASRFFKGVNLDVLRATGGHMDLPTLAVIGFMAAGATEVVVKKKLPIPPWFNLGWWAFRTFTTMEKKAIKKTQAPFRPGNGEKHGAPRSETGQAPEAPPPPAQERGSS